MVQVLPSHVESEWGGRSAYPICSKRMAIKLLGLSTESPLASSQPLTVGRTAINCADAGRRGVS